jgi:hypothetical protein
MPEMRAKASQAILEAQWLRLQGRALRSEAQMLARRLGETMVRSRALDAQVSTQRTSLDQSIAAANACAEQRVLPPLAACDELAPPPQDDSEGSEPGDAAPS